MIYKEIYIIKNWEVLTSSKRSLESQSGEELGGKSYSDNPSFRCATLIATKRSAMLHALKSRLWVLGHQMQPNEYKRWG